MNHWDNDHHAWEQINVHSLYTISCLFLILYRDEISECNDFVEGSFIWQGLISKVGLMLNGQTARSKRFSLKKFGKLWITNTIHTVKF